MEKTLALLRALGIEEVKKYGISILRVESPAGGVEVLKKIIQEVVGRKTALFLSGGKTPRDLYSQLAIDHSFSPGAVALIDERYGQPFHKISNERMIKETGLLDYLEKNNIRFFSPLEDGKSREQCARDYDETVRFIFANFPETFAILGIGRDGHTAGIPAISNLKSQISNLTKELKEGKLLAVDYNDAGGFYKERITTTFKALSLMDTIVVLVFGDDKKNALKKLFTEGPTEEVPARFLKQKGIAEKTLLITDQNF